MSQETVDKQDFLGRRVRLRCVLLGVVLAAVVMVVIVVSLLMVDRHHDDERRAAAAAAAAANEVTSPYDFSELPADSDLDDIAHAAFVSVSLADESGQLTSYGISSEVPAAQTLIQAVRAADEVDYAIGATSTSVAGGAPGSGTDAAAVSTVTFVFPDRGILTFALELDQGLIARGDQAWRPNGDLRALVEAIVAAGQ